MRNDPPTAKMILVSAGTDPSAPVPLLATEHQKIVRKMRFSDDEHT